MCYTVSALCSRRCEACSVALICYALAVGCRLRKLCPHMLYLLHVQTRTDRDGFGFGREAAGHAPVFRRYGGPAAGIREPRSCCSCRSPDSGCCGSECQDSATRKYSSQRGGSPTPPAGQRRTHDLHVLLHMQQQHTRETEKNAENKMQRSTGV